MKELFKLGNIGDAGLNSDRLPFDLPPEYITIGENFRARDGYISPLYGSSLVLTAPEGVEEVGFIKSIRNKIGDYWVIASRKQVFLSFGQALGWADISSGNYGIPEGGQYDWTGTQLGQVLVMNNPNSFAQYWTSQSVTPTLIDLPFSPGVTWSDSGVRCKSMRAHKNFLIALNLGGTEDSPNGYRISHPADTNGIPFTWDTTARDSIAVKAQLGGDGGEIVDGLTLRDSFVIYSRNSIDVLTFNPGSEFYWTRREMSATVGLLSTNCLTEVKGKHYLIVDSDIVVNDGSTIESILYGKLLRRFNSRVNDNTQYNSFVVRNDIKHEVWFCVPEDDSITASMAYIYNWKSNAWSLSALTEGVASMAYGLDPVAVGETNKGTWRHGEGLWSENVGPWNSRDVSTIDEILASVSVDGVVSNHDPRGNIDQDAFDTVVERTDIPLLEHRGTFSATRVYPLATGAKFEIQIGAQHQAGGPVGWSNSFEFDPGIDRYVDFRLTGELIGYRVKSIGKNTFRISGIQVEYVPAGER